VRVFEISDAALDGYDAKYFGIKMPAESYDDDYRRCMTSTIWYTP